MKLHAAFLVLAASLAWQWAAAGDAAEGVLAASGCRGGLVVQVGCGDGALVAALAARPGFLAHGLATEPAAVARARAQIHKAGLDGKASVSLWRGGALPFVDNLVNLLLLDEGANVERSEAFRVVAPGGAVCTRRDGRWEVRRKPRPGDLDEWTHYLHDPSNNAVAHDRQVGPPRHMQWLGEPLWSRYHHTLASISSVVSAGGRVFYIADEATCASMAVPGRWSLFARDAFSGVLLWKRPLRSWAWHKRKFRSGPVQLPRTLVASGERVFLPLAIDAPLSALDAATGKTIRTYPQAKGVEEVLFAGGTLFVVVGRPGPEQAAVDPALSKLIGFPNHKAIVAVEATTGRTLWEWDEPKTARYMPLTLAVRGGRAFFQAGDGVVCLDAKTGKQLWASALAADPPRKQNAKKSKSRRALGRRSPGWAMATLVVADGAVLLAEKGKLTALAAANGKRLWEAPCRDGFRSPPDVFVIGGLVWTGPAFDQGRDLHTGEVEKTTSILTKLRTAGHHHRCYRQKATERYILENYRGVEFLDLLDNDHSRNNWIRGTCQYGVMPANGLLYAPPQACGCYMEGLLHGFWAVASRRESRPSSAAPRLERGPAWGGSWPAARAQPTDWPTYRHEPLRSGSTSQAVPAKPTVLWRTRLGGKVTAPVVAQGAVFLAQADAHRVVALDLASGKVRWEFAAGGRVDSPPTFHAGLVLFGCADGWVYCLRADDGQPVWRFRAAPEDLRTVARDRVESVWPVHGSVLVLEGVAYVAAGRNSYLDGGFWLWGLEPRTGKVVARGRLEGKHPRGAEGASRKPPQRFTQNAVDGKTLEAPDHSDAFSMFACRSDVLVSDGTSVFLHHLRFNRQLELQKSLGRHLFSTNRLLDGAENHRCHWVLGTGDFRRLPVAYSWIANSPRSRWGVRLARPYGLLLAFDDQRAWGVRRRNGYLLFSLPNRPFSPKEKPTPDFRKASEVGEEKFLWSSPLSFRPRALVRAGKALIVAGVPPLAGDDPKSVEAFEGRDGGVVAAYSTAEGKKLWEMQVEAAPAWDGAAVAGGRLVLAATDGSVMAFGAAR